MTNTYQAFRIWITSIVAIIITTTTLSANDIKFIDAEEELMQRASIPIGITSTRTCHNTSGCTRHCSKRPQCHISKELKNIRDVEIHSVKIFEPRLSEIPTTRNTLVVDQFNCTSNVSHFKES